jgi:hypothetical protein
VPLDRPCGRMGAAGPMFQPGGGTTPADRTAIARGGKHEEMVLESPEEEDTEAKRREGMNRTMCESIQSGLVMLAAGGPKTVELQLYETIRLWLVMIALHAPVYFLWGWVLFRHWADFWDAFSTWGIDEPWSYDEEPGYDPYAPAKIAAWFFAPIGLIGLEIRLLGW